MLQIQSMFDQDSPKRAQYNHKPWYKRTMVSSVRPKQPSHDSRRGSFPLNSGSPITQHRLVLDRASAEIGHHLRQFAVRQVFQHKRRSAASALDEVVREPVRHACREEGVLSMISEFFFYTRTTTAEGQTDHTTGRPQHAP